MSRKGRTPIALPKGVEINVSNSLVTVKGPKGTLKCNLSKGIQVKVDGSEIYVSVDETAGPEASRMHGLSQALVANMVKGTSEGWNKELEFIGVGYRAAVQGQVIDLQLGYSHPVKLDIPQGIEVKIEKGTKVTVAGIDRQVVGQFAASIRDLRRPEPYKGKGVRYVGEFVRRKAGKSGKR